MRKTDEERREAARRRRHTAERYRRITQALTDYVYTVWVRKGKVVATEHGEACQTVTGYSPEEFASDPGLWLSMVAVDDRPAVIAQAVGILSGQCLSALEHRIRRKDGALRWIRNTPVPHYDHAGALSCYDGVIQDITARKEMEEKALRSQKMEALGLLSSGVAHDLNNILTLIIGFDSLLLDGLKPDDPLASFARDINRAAWMAAAVSQQMLVLSQKQVERPRIVDLNAIVIEMGKLLRRILPSDVLTVRDLTPSAWLVKADISRLQQVILNLVINARDSMPSGGKILISTKNLTILKEGQPDLRPALSPGHYLCLEVRDTGIGMDKPVRDRIFEPFFTTKGPGRGTGLGLSTILSIVEQYAGRILVESEPGKGTTFRIFLPRAEGVAAAILPGESSADIRGGSETILLVEDHKDLGRLVRKILRAKGYRILRASRAREALAMSDAQTAPIDLLLTDIVLPDIYGGQLAAKIRAKRPEIRIVYMSGDPDAAFGKMARAPDGDILDKPFTPAELLTAVRTALDSSAVSRYPESLPVTAAASASGPAGLRP